MAVVEDTPLWLAVAMLLVAASATAAAAMAWKLQDAQGKASAKSKSKLLLPPGPKGLPVIGILHLLARAHGSRGLHRLLAELAEIHGDIMYMPLGRVPAVVAFSMEAAQLFLKTHDVAFASRPPNAVTDYVFYGGRDVIFAPYGQFWRHARKLCVVHLLNSRKLYQIESFSNLREAESKAMAAELWRRSCRGAMAVDLSAAFQAMLFNIMWRALAGDTFPELLGPLTNLVSHISELALLPLAGDYVPWLRFLDLPTIWRMKKVSSTFDAFLQSLLDRPTKQCLDSSNETTFLGTLQKLAGRDPLITPTVIKALTLDLFGAGTETTSSTLEWSTTLMLKHTSCVQRLQQELDQVVGRDRQVQESDISNMKYLRCVVKESMRLFPVIPLGAPHLSTEQVTVRGFTLPKGTVLMMNYWAMNRDPAVWKSPHEFRPERFLDHDVLDLSGLSDFKSLAFGAGRRMCPGVDMALATVLLVLARLFHTFQWVPNGDIDMEERPGIVVGRKNPLVAVPKLRLSGGLL